MCHIISDGSVRTNAATCTPTDLIQCSLNCGCCWCVVGSRSDSSIRRVVLNLGRILGIFVPYAKGEPIPVYLSLRPSGFMLRFSCCYL